MSDRDPEDRLLAIAANGEDLPQQVEAVERLLGFFSEEVGVGVLLCPLLQVVKGRVVFEPLPVEVVVRLPRGVLVHVVAAGPFFIYWRVGHSGRGLLLPSFGDYLQDGDNAAPT